MRRNHLWGGKGGRASPWGSHHDFRRDEVFSFTSQTLHLSLLLPVHRVINASFFQGSTGGLEVSTWNIAEGSSEQVGWRDEEEEEEEHQFQSINL